MKLFLSLILIQSCLIGSLSVFASTPEQDLSESIKILQSKKAYSSRHPITFSFKGDLEVNKPCTIRFQNFSTLEEWRTHNEQSVEPNRSNRDVYETFSRHVNEVRTEFVENPGDKNLMLFMINFKRETPFTVDGLPSKATLMIFDLPYKTQNEKENTMKGLTLFNKALTELQKRCQE